MKGLHELKRANKLKRKATEEELKKLKQSQKDFFRKPPRPLPKTNKEPEQICRVAPFFVVDHLEGFLSTEIRFGGKTVDIQDYVNSMKLNIIKNHLHITQN